MNNINKCINCHYFETERSYYKSDENGNSKFSAPCYLTKERHFEDFRCDKIKLFEYFKNNKL